MQGSLALREGVLWVGRHELTGHVRPFDLDGAPLGPGFSFRGPGRSRASVEGLDVDGDHHLWVADGAGSTVRAFTLSGREVRTLGRREEASRDARGSLGRVADVAALEDGEEPLLAIACGGRRRHAVQLFRPEGGWVASLRSQGAAGEAFHGARSVTGCGALLFVCEASAGRIQVFRCREFHFSIAVPTRPGARFEPTALAPLDDGRLVVTAGGEDGALLLLDGGGRLIRVLAEGGRGAGRLFEPADVVADSAAAGRPARIAVIDRDGERVQVFNLDGTCYGALEDMPGSGHGTR